MDKKLDEYYDKFDEGFPMIPVAWGRTDEQVVAIIDECIAKNKNVYELGYASEDDNIEY